MQVMLYAEVIVATRTNTQELTYAVSAKIIPYIRLGSLVTVPLRRKIVRAVVVGLRRTVPSHLRQKIRELIEIDRSNSISAESIKVIRILAEYYGASIAEVAYHALQKNQPEVARPAAKLDQRDIYIQAPWRPRLQEYLRLISEHPGKSLIIFSQQQYQQEFTQAINRLHDDVKGKCIAVTLAGAFTYLPTGSMVIVDQPYHIGGKSARRPFMSSRTIAKIRSQVEGHSLVIGNGVLAAEDILSIGRNTAKLISIPPLAKPFTVVQQTNTVGIGESAVAEITDRLAKKKTVVVLTPSNSWSPALFCTKCEQAIECPKCSRTIGLSSPEVLLCQYCGYTQGRFTSCPICQNQTIIDVGFGIKQLTKSLRKTFPSSVIVEQSDEKVSEAQIVVSTEKYFGFPNQHHDFAVLVGWDRLISGVLPESNWRLLNYIVEIQDQVESVLIETLFPEHELWGVVNSEKLRKFFQNELSERRQFSLPPFGQIIRIIGLGSVRPLQQQSQLLIERLENIGYNVVASQPRNRGKNYLITLTIFSPKKLTSKQKVEIKNILQPSWHLDIDNAF